MFNPAKLTECLKRALENESDSGIKQMMIFKNLEGQMIAKASKDENESGQLVQIAAILA